MSLNIRRYCYWDSRWIAQDFLAYSDGMQLHWDAFYSGMVTVKVANPNYIFFLYRNVRDVHDSIDEIFNGMKELDYFRQQGWVLKDVAGNEVIDTGYYGNRVCDIGNPTYQQWIADWYYNQIRLRNYPACFLDNGQCPTSSSWAYAASGRPINPRTGTLFTDAEIQNAYTSMYSVIRQRLGNNIIMVANSVGVSTGYKYFRYANYRLPTLSMLSHLDGFMSEQWLSQVGQPYFPELQTPNYDWKDSIDLLVDLENAFSGKNVILVATCTEDSPASLPTDAEKQQYSLFQYASMLLGIGTKNIYWLFLGYWGNKNSDVFNMNVGTPLGSYYQDVNGLYVRNFTNGTVSVNPSLTVKGGLNPHTAVISIASQRRYAFSHWQDGDVNPTKTVVV